MTAILTSSDLTLQLGELIEGLFEAGELGSATADVPRPPIAPGSPAHRALVLALAALVEGLGPMGLVRRGRDAGVGAALRLARDSIEGGLDVATLAVARSILVRSVHQHEAAIERWSFARLAVARSPGHRRLFERYLRVCRKLARRRLELRTAKAALGLLDVVRDPSPRRVADFVREVGEAAAAAETARFHANPTKISDVLRIGWLRAAVRAQHARQLDLIAWETCVAAVDTAEALLRHVSSHAFAASAGALIAWSMSGAPIRREHAASA